MVSQVDPSVLEDHHRKSLNSRPEGGLTSARFRGMRGGFETRPAQNPLNQHSPKILEGFRENPDSTMPSVSRSLLLSRCAKQRGGTCPSLMKITKHSTDQSPSINASRSVATVPEAQTPHFLTPGRRKKSERCQTTVASLRTSLQRGGVALPRKREREAEDRSEARSCFVHRGSRSPEARPDSR
jgi:hypothetical protein